MNSRVKSAAGIRYNGATPRAIVPEPACFNKPLAYTDTLMLRTTLPVLALVAAVGTPVPAADVPEAAANHWAFKAPVRPAVPKATAWAKNPIDAFVQLRLEKEGVDPHVPWLYNFKLDFRFK